MTLPLIRLVVVSLASAPIDAVIFRHDFRNGRFGDIVSGRC
jgi:hypothetical protein